VLHSEPEVLLKTVEHCHGSVDLRAEVEIIIALVDELYHGCLRHADCLARDSALQISHEFAAVPDVAQVGRRPLAPKPLDDASRSEF